MSCLQIATNLTPPQDVRRQFHWGNERPFQAGEAEASVCLYSLWSRMMIQRSPTCTQSAGDANQHLHLVFQWHCDQGYKAPNKRPKTCLFVPTFAGVLTKYLAELRLPQLHAQHQDVRPQLPHRQQDVRPSLVRRQGQHTRDARYT